MTSLTISLKDWLNILMKRNRLFGGHCGSTDHQDDRQGGGHWNSHQFVSSNFALTVITHFLPKPGVSRAKKGGPSSLPGEKGLHTADGVAALLKDRNTLASIRAILQRVLDALVQADREIA